MLNTLYKSYQPQMVTLLNSSVYTNWIELYLLNYI